MRTAWKLQRCCARMASSRAVATWKAPIFATTGTACCWLAWRFRRRCWAMTKRSPRPLSGFRWQQTIFSPMAATANRCNTPTTLPIAIILAREAIVRRSPSTALMLEPYARMVHWASQALFYRKPLSGWGRSPAPAVPISVTAPHFSGLRVTCSFTSPHMRGNPCRSRPGWHDGCLIHCIFRPTNRRRMISLRLDSCRGLVSFRLFSCRTPLPRFHPLRLAFPRQRGSPGCTRSPAMNGVA